MHIVTEIRLAFGFRLPSDIITDRVKTFCIQNISHATTNYISFLISLYIVGFLSQLLFDINWFILEYIISCIGQGLQILFCLVELLASIFSLFIFYVIIFSLPLGE